MSGVDNLVRMIEEEASKDADEIIKEAEERRKEILKEADQKIESLKKKMLKEAKEKAKDEITKKRAATELNAKQKILEAKNKILLDVFKNADEEIQKIPKSKAYESQLIDLVGDASEALEEDELNLVFPEGHSKSFKKTKAAKELKKRTGRNIKLNISDESIRASGGVIVRNKDSTKWVDNTFEGRKERMESELRDHVSNLLFG